MKTSTKNVIITSAVALICSIISSLETKEYINSKQEQIQKQSVTVNIGGQDISYQSEDVANLNRQIEQLKIENQQLFDSNNSLENQLNQSISFQNINLCDYSLFINGVEQNIINNNSVIEYNAHNYIRDDILSLIDIDISFDNSNNKIIIGDDVGETYLLMKECPPYETSGIYSTDPFTMQGENYSNGFVIFTSEYRDILFNLKNNYSSLEFDVGHIDESGDYMCVINFYIDDVYVKTVTKNPQDDITHEIIPLNYGKILRIEVITKKAPTASPMCAKYGLANMLLLP